MLKARAWPIAARTRWRARPRAPLPSNSAWQAEARILEIISPAGFERCFAELVDLGGVAQADPETLAELCARYGLEMDPGSIPGLLERFDLRLGEPI